MKTPLMKLVHKAIRLAALSREVGQPPADELADIYLANQSRRISRREFLENTTKTALALGGAAVLPSWTYANLPPITARIAIIGAGIAGLTAAHYLKKAGVNTFTIYEGDKRVGGRIFTQKDVIAQNLLTEVGGEYIDSHHKDMFRLAKEYELEMSDTFKDLPGLKKEAFFFDNRHYTLAEVVKAFQQLIPQFKKDKLSLDAEYDNEAAQALDYLPLSEYVTGLQADTWFKSLLEVAYMSEFGAPISEQSTLNLLDMIDLDRVNEFNVYGSSDERYKIKGGNSSLTNAMAAALGSSIQTDMKLTSIYSVGKRYLLTFNNRYNIETDIVLLAIPFTVLRNIDVKIEGFHKVKRLCINELGYGSNAKIMLGFYKRFWRNLGYVGYLFNETIHNGWDNGLQQSLPITAAQPGGYTIFLGGQDALGVEKGFEQELARKYVVELNRVFPGAVEQYNGKAYVADWHRNPFSLGSYSYYKPGQWTTISGLEIEPIGNVFFAGEHCSAESQGYMNGGAETGRLAAQSILKRLKGK